MKTRNWIIGKVLIVLFGLSLTGYLVLSKTSLARKKCMQYFLYITFTVATVALGSLMEDMGLIVVTILSEFTLEIISMFIFVYAT